MTSGIDAPGATRRAGDVASRAPERWRRRAGTSGRVTGVDVARGLALIGMFVAHVAPAATTEAGAELIALADERPRLLFALVAGVGLGLLTGGRNPGRCDPPTARRQVAIRGALLVAIGLVVIEVVRPLVFVILDVYGVAFLVMVPLLFIPARWALAAGVALTVVMPAVVVAADGPLDAVAVPDAGRLVLDWFVTGAYPVVIWVPVMLLGLGIARAGIRERRVVHLAALWGAAAAVVGLPAARVLGSPLPPTGSAQEAIRAGLETAGNVGVGLVVLAACVALGEFAPPALRTTWSSLTSPVAAMGAMPLTVYTAHLVVIAGAKRVEDGIVTDDSWPLLLGLVLGSMAFAWTWQRFVGRGPLEMLMRAASGRDRTVEGSGPSAP
ncbi:heparan-alpha-glucosaminide N-acetyltransferase domain-containing protein [Agromyces sp. SYSU T0242]|uniref:heparan-alpha-glucosaminide N-acetyltransferase domain-containing protein n=1 Tax=Agromyces litoreus TaxID=3158561 RepID=UPI00339B144F